MRVDPRGKRGASARVRHGKEHHPRLDIRKFQCRSGPLTLPGKPEAEVQRQLEEARRIAESHKLHKGIEVYAVPRVTEAGKRVKGTPTTVSAFMICRVCGETSTMGKSRSGGVVHPLLDNRVFKNVTLRAKKSRCVGVPAMLRTMRIKKLGRFLKHFRAVSRTAERAARAADPRMQVDGALQAITSALDELGGSY